MKEDNSIILGKGIGGIIFGMTMEDVIAIVDDVFEKSQTSHSDGSLDIHLYYKQRGIQFGFSSEEDCRLTDITVKHSMYIIEGRLSVGQTINEIKHNAMALGLENPSIEVLLEESSENNLLEVMWFDESSCSIWFKDGISYEISISPFWEDDENYLFHKV